MTVTVELPPLPSLTCCGRRYTLVEPIVHYPPMLSCMDCGTEYCLFWPRFHEGDPTLEWVKYPKAYAP